MPIDDTQLSVAFYHGGAGDWAWLSFVQVATHPEPTVALAQLRDNDEFAWLSPIGTNLEDRARLDTLGEEPFGITARTQMSANWAAVLRIVDDLDALPLGFKAVVQQLDLHQPRDPSKTYHRVVYRGMQLPAYTNELWVRSDAGATRCGYTVMRLFNRDIVISQISSGDNRHDCFLGVTLEGAFFSQSELDALELIIYLLAGIGGVRQCVESFDANGRCHSRSFQRLGHGAFYEPKGVFPATLYQDPTFYTKIATVMSNAQALIEKAFPLRAILFHIFASQQPVPEISITHLAIALDGMKNAVVEKIQGEGKLMPQELFDQRIAPVVAAAHKEFSQENDKENLELIVRRIKDANDWSDRQRWLRFWRDYAGIRLNDDERRVLRHRGPAVHDAYILSTEYDLALDAASSNDERAYEVRLRELHNDAHIFRNILNRVLLKLFRYEGDILDFTDPRRVLDTTQNGV